MTSGGRKMTLRWPKKGTLFFWNQHKIPNKKNVELTWPYTIYPIISIVISFSIVCNQSPHFLICLHQLSYTLIF